MESDSSIDQDLCPPPKKIGQNQNQCTVCGKQVFDRRNLVRHMRHVHFIEPEVRKPSLKCSFNEDCTFICGSTDLLRNHLKLAHNFKGEERILNFPSKAEFEKWKIDEEVRTNARYVAYTGMKNKSSGKVFYLRCHRNGSVQSENHERKRARTDEENTQSGVNCPSTMKVSESADGTIEAVYYPDHLGHRLDDESVRFMKLNPVQKKQILDKLNFGDPVGKIVIDARNIKGDRLTRLNFLQRRDVYNLKKKIDYLEKDDEQDAKMVQTWIKGLNLEDEEQSPIVHYSPLNEYKNYSLVLIHDVQKEIFKRVFDGLVVYVKIKKGKPNLDFNLTVVSIVSSNGEAFPIAVCVSQKTEYMSLHTFYQTIFRNYGKITPKFFVSDNLNQSYLAWKNVMGECEKRMICIFDLESYWGQKLSQQRVPTHKQKNVTAKLKSLLYELDKDKFEDDLDKTMREWCEDQSMKTFLCFFQKYYASKSEEWAGCYRTYSDSNQTIDVSLESINQTFDTVYAERHIGVGNILNIIMSRIRDACMLRLIELEGTFRMEKILATEQNHIEGAEIRNIRTNGSEWLYSQNDCDYIVKKVVNNCDKECGLFCSFCDVCVHQYSCLCKDYVLGFNFCKHIHAARMAMARADEAKEKTAKLEMENLEKVDAGKKKEKKDKKEKKKKTSGGKVTKQKKCKKAMSGTTSKPSTVSAAEAIVDDSEKSELPQADTGNAGDLSDQENLNGGTFVVVADVHV